LITVVKGGDQASGMIHPDEYPGVGMALPEAVPNIAHVFAQQLMHWSAHFDEVRVVGVVGNHTRTTKRIAFKKPAERSWDRSIYRIAKALTATAGNIEWVLPDGLGTVYDVMGWRCYVTHGAEIPMNNRTPYYPIESTIQRELGMRHAAKHWMKSQGIDDVPDSDFDLAYMFHFHHHAVMSDVITICPSVIGGNEYSKSKIHQYSLPRTLLQFFSEKHNVESERLINLMGANGHEFVDPVEVL